jgi:hypothetical protein
MISGFTFVHNAIDSGYPIVEAIRAVQPYVDEVCVVDMQSTDNTRQVLEKLSVKIIDDYWGNEAGETLRQALIKYIVELIKYDHTDISVHRLQLEQNFQRCRWYPEPVHRVFSRLSHTRKEGHTTDNY